MTAVTVVTVVTVKITESVSLFAIEKSMNFSNVPCFVFSKIFIFAPELVRQCFD